MSLVYVTLLPNPPRVPERQRPEHLHTEYRSGGGDCQPKRLAAIADAAARTDKAEECAREAENYRIEKETLTQAARVTDAAEETLRVGYSQTQIAFIQAILSTLAVAFTGWAAWEAGRAARAALASVDDARADAEQQEARFTSQLGLAQQAATSAAESAAAMQSVAESMAVNATQIVRSVDISQQISDRQKLLGETQLRAHVSILAGRFARLQDRQTGVRFETQPLMRNTGHTAARNIRWRLRCGVLPNPIPNGFRFPIPAHQEGSSFLPGGETFTITAIMEGMVNDDLVFPAAAGVNGWGFYVWGYVVYEDIFRRSHRTTFAHQIIFEQAGPKDQNWMWPPPEIRGSYLAKHNRAN